MEGQVPSGPSAGAGLGAQPPAPLRASQLLAQPSRRGPSFQIRAVPLDPSFLLCHVSAPGLLLSPVLEDGHPCSRCHQAGPLLSPLRGGRQPGPPVSSRAHPCACLCPGCLFFQGPRHVDRGPHPTPRQPHPDLTGYTCGGPRLHTRPRPEVWGSGFHVGV